MPTAFLVQTSVSIFPLGLEFVGFHRRHFHATVGISGKFWNFSWIIKKLLGTIRKLLLFLLLLLLLLLIFFYRFQTCSMHILLEVDHEKNALCYARASSFAIDFKKRVDSSKFLHSMRVTFARPIAWSRATSRNFLSNAIRNTESFLEGHVPLLKPASARRASNCTFFFFKEKYTKINRCLPGRVSIFGSKQESFAPRLHQNNATRLCAYAQGDSHWQSRSPRKSKKWKILFSVTFSNSFMLCFG